ncbi:acid phosphatase-domain-containing protein [Amanita rubescens]|nr:acid phosphatase-domain-containing protein [Amanita rubescens]
MTFPKVVGLDTDWTIWQRQTGVNLWGKGRGPAAKLEDNMNRVDRWLIQDKTNPNNVYIRVFDDISKIVNDILKNGAQLAIVSNNSVKALTDRALYYYNTINPANGKEWSIIHLVKYDEVQLKESKVLPFRRINNWSQQDFAEMLLFDDEAYNNTVRVTLGVSFELARDKKGLTWDVYQRGLGAWRRAKTITIPRGPAPNRQRKLIAYSGISPLWQNLVNKGEGIVETGIPYRWGYAFYAGDIITTAKLYKDFERRGTGAVCEVWVRDYELWCNLNKIWVPNSHTPLPTMSNMSWPAETTGMNQENRDKYISETWHVSPPYVLFCNHPAGGTRRYPEMVMPTLVQRNLIEIVALTNAQVAASEKANPSPMPFVNQMKTWKITVPKPTRDEFLRYREMNYYNNSA